MGGYESELPARNAEGDLVAAAQHIVAALGTKKILSQDERKILVDLRTRLTAMSMVDDSKVIESPTKGVSETEEYLNIVSEKITNRVSDETMIWDMGPEDASEYLKAVDEARVLTENLENLCLNKDDEEVELLRKAHDVLQTAMARLEEEFGHIIVQHSQPFEPEHKSFRSSERGDLVGSPISLEDDPLEDSLQRESVGKNLEDYIVDLVHPDVIPDLKCIANMMFISNYDHECSQAYVNARKHALSRCLFVLEVEPLSIDDVLKMEWGSLDSQIKRWVWALKIFVRGYLASEKRLCDDIFGEFGSLSSLCFTDSSKASVMQLLSFGDAVAVSPRQPEKLFRILDMYEVLAELHPDINSLYADQAIRDEFCEVLRRLGDAVRATFLEFRNAIANNASVNPFAGGGTHHLTRYVMNYLRLLTDYKDTLNQILEDAEREESLSPMADSVAFGDEVNQFDSTCNATPMAFHFRSLTSALIANIDEKSKLYKDPALQHFFLMNNIYYIAQKVKHSELRDIFGDDWIKRHNGKFQQQAMNYERATWSFILSLLKDDGSENSGSNSSIKNVLKERLRSFYASFEEVYRNQTGWLVRDPQLQEDLRISTSLKVIQAYRTFVGRHSNEISDKYIKYTADDLENYILDLFSGSQRSLNNICRR
ncbi:exocyst complex component EXO70E2-like [Chenopodium quinoa]|uniref:Exocyst subunit Exo70 family protein n=1 Tax=Chenopodium quinoa TaxID=63459 RepID=A0A803LSJ1_CHEQI|nr:exocyst complex component EXO70E2-like [Chenopodium quinoa]